VTAIGQYQGDGTRRSIRFERTYDAPAEDVWAALTEPARLRGWLAPAGAEIEGRDGGGFEFRMSDDEAHRVWGTVRTWSPPSLLEIEWHFEGQSESVVRFELEPRGEATQLVLEHRDLPQEQAAGYGSGWHAYLDALDDHLTGGSGSWQERFDERLELYRERADGEQG
jgi:uncharacterized protein YndB with AHSA1/START domain